jgi:hypothetical protein
LPSFCVKCGVKLSEDSFREGQATLCPNCMKETLMATTAPPIPQSTISQEQQGESQPSTQFTVIYYQPRQFLDTKLNNFSRQLIEAFALLFGFALIGFMGLELGATISGFFGYSDFMVFAFPMIALCEIVFVLVLLREYGSIHFW